MAQTAKLEAILSTAICAIITIDSSGTIDSVNPATTILFGYDAKELVGRNINVLMPEPDASQHDHYIEKYLRTGERQIIGSGREVSARRKDGSTFPIHLAVSEFEVDGERHFAGIITDLSIRRAAQDALGEAERRLAHVQKMEAVGQLAGGIAHDFNNLLTVIIGNLELMEPRLADDELRRTLRRVQEAATSGSELTQRLLGFSRLLPLDPHNVNVNELVLDTMELLRRTIGENISLSTALASETWNVRIDPGQIENALTNLTINARDAMPNGGRILVETGNIRINADQVSAGLDLSPGDYVVLSVTDTGSGIPDEIRSRIFEPFFTTKPKGRGTGLGLAMIYGFVKQSGGHVTACSEVGRGTTFKLYLPRAENDRAATSAVEAPKAEKCATTSLVLLVEDDPALRQLNAERLEQLGYKVVEAATGIDALNLIAKGLRPDLVFTDIIMPGGVSGIDLLERVAHIAPSVRFLLTSGYAVEATRADEQPLAARLLRKPYRMVDLAKALNAALNEPSRR